MIGVILAAGIGSRLRPLTDKKPKCMIKVCNKAILQYQLEAYCFAGIKTVYIVVGYKNEIIKNFCRHFKGMEIVFVNNEEYEATNNLYSLYLCRDYVSGKSFIWSNADVVFPENLIQDLKSTSHENLIAVQKGIYYQESMKVTIDETGSIKNISKEIAPENSGACSIDLYKCGVHASVALFNELTDFIEKKQERGSWVEVALQSMLYKRTHSFMPYDIGDCKWVEVDNIDDLLQADRVFSPLREILDSVRVCCFDLDGTVCLDGAEIKGSIDAIKELQVYGKDIYFCSNNSSKSKKDYLNFLQKMGLENITSENIILSQDALIKFCLENFVQRVWILGTDSLKKQFMEHGFTITDHQPEYVVIGYDIELDYQKLQTACHLIWGGVEYLATHVDITCPTKLGPIPDVGAITKLIEITTGKAPSHVFGKPSGKMLEFLLEKHSIDSSEILILGDRLYTDIAMAKNFNCKSFLVLTGETKRGDLENSSVMPDVIIESLKNVFNAKTME